MRFKRRCNITAYRIVRVKANQRQTVQCTAILQRSRSPVAREVVSRIERRNPDERFVVGSVKALIAACKCIGNICPRFAARRAMPWSAFRLKKYFSGAVSSKIDDNKHPSAPLWDSEVLSVKNPVGNVHRPAFLKRTEDAREIASRLTGECA